MRQAIRTALALSLTAACAAGYAGTVDVQYTNASKYVDAGTSRWDEEDNMKALGNWMQQLGRKYLPPDQSLQVEVLDVDLAGSVQVARRDATLIRVVKGRTDYPRITLRYSLRDAAGRVLRNGEESVVDLDFTRGLPRSRDFSGLHYEKHMLQQWFRQRFVEQQAAR